ncbi:MAG: hypothetical protein ACRDG7_19510 [Candidatus Limnocylindria bacterium]
MRPGLMDEVMVNANLLEHRPDSTASALRATTLPYCIDPVLTRFQVPEWWKNEKGETKRNYARLGAAYVRGTSVQIAAGPLLETVPTDDEWRTIAGNVMEYQRNRLVDIHPQLELFRAELRPVRLLAPALVAFTVNEDRVNRVLLEAAADAAAGPVGLPVVIPPERLADPASLRRLIDAVPFDGVNSYFIWTPGITESRLLDDAMLLHALLSAVETLAGRGMPVAHLHAGYLVFALHDLGMAAVVHHLGWVDRGEPAHQAGGGPRSCQTYVPGVRRTIRFDRAAALGYGLSAMEYRDRYCSCNFCIGAMDAGEHPLDLLLESHRISDKRGRSRMTPTSRAAALNTWHYLHGRRQEVERFSRESAGNVVWADIERASALAGAPEGERLRRIVSELGG